MKLKSLSAYAVGLFVGLAQMTSATAQTTDYSSYYKNLPINQPQVSAPVIPAYEIKITDFGGVNDGVTLNTEAFAKAMAHLASKGGGRLVVPEGIWYTGPIAFVNNVALNLERGALVLFSENIAD